MWRGNFDTMEQKFSNIHIFWWSNNSSRKMLICVHKDWSTTDVCYSSLHVCVCAKSLQCVQLIATLWTVACQAPLSVRILQTRILEWVAMPSSRGSPRPRDQTPALQAVSVPSEPLHTYIYSFLYSFPLRFVPRYWIVFSVLYNRTLLFIHSICNTDFHTN